MACSTRTLGNFFFCMETNQNNEYPLCKFNISCTPKVKQKLMIIFLHTEVSYETNITFHTFVIVKQNAAVMYIKLI